MFRVFRDQRQALSLQLRLAGGEGGIRKSVLIQKSLLANSLKSGNNLIVGIVAVTI
jgi:hypothetical protein